MDALEKREYIHNNLYRIGDKNIDELFRKVKSLVERDITLTVAQEEEVKKRYARHKNGESESYSWNNVKNRAKAD